MSDSGGTCEYVLDPDDPETWGGEEGDECYVDEEVLNDEGVWTCPHDADEGEHLCIFHLPVEKKRNENSIRRIGVAVQEYLGDDDSMIHSRKNQFIGAKFETFELPKQSEFGFGDETSINLQHTKVQKGISCRQVNFELDISFHGSSIWGESDFSAAKFRGEVVFEGVNFYGQVDFSYSKFENRSSFAGSVFNKDVVFEGSNFEDNAFFNSIVCECWVNFDKTTFNEDCFFQNSEFKQESHFRDSTFYNATFAGATFRGPSLFEHSKFQSEGDFQDVVFGEYTDFKDTEFCGEGRFFAATYEGETEYVGAEFKNTSDFKKTSFNSETYFSLGLSYEDSFEGSRMETDTRGVLFEMEADFQNATFNEPVWFSQSQFNAGIDFETAEFKSEVYFRNTNLSNSNFSQSYVFNGFFNKSNLSEADLSNSEFINSDLTKVDLTETDFSGANISNTKLERALLNRVDLFGTNFRESVFYGAVIGDAQINEETEFGERCAYDPEFDDGPITDIDDDDTGRLTKAAGQYRLIEQLARTNAFPDMVSHNFIRRQDIHREQHRQEGRWGRWLRATASKYVLEYGENPWRLIATGLIIVGTFGVLYPLVGGLQPTSGSTITLSRTLDNPILLLQSIYYSTLTFTTLGMGDFLPVGLGRVLTTIETSLGAIIIALLVFVFGRRAAR